MSQNPNGTIRQHRRQQSTPMAYDPSKLPTMPTGNSQNQTYTQTLRQSAHRRGISLDQRPRQMPEQQSSRINLTNLGLQRENTQQILQESQQQRMMQRQQQQQQPYYQKQNSDPYLISPSVTPNRQSFDGGDLDIFASQPSNQFQQFPERIDTSFINTNNNQFQNNNSQAYPDTELLTPSAYFDFTRALEGLPEDNWNSTIKATSRPNSRPQSRHVVDRVNSYENSTLRKSTSRPITPPGHESSSYFPKLEQPSVPLQAPQPRRFAEDYDTSMEETIKAPTRRNSPAKSNFDAMRDLAEQPPPPTIQNLFSETARMPPTSFAGRISRTESPQLPPHLPQQVQDYRSPYHSPQNDMTDYEDSPEMGHRTLNNSSYPDLPSSEMDYHQGSKSRSHSISSAYDEAIQNDTGITSQDIAMYISSPSPTDQKYTCLYPVTTDGSPQNGQPQMTQLCNKRFGRRENIKSHIQTHLGDRQFQCPHCQKCFVRQHDLKRHAKIHSGVKEFECKCGSGFARMDALTRHRQRGMCVGALPGFERKDQGERRRGRPRKIRPDDENPDREGSARVSRSPTKSRSPVKGERRERKNRLRSNTMSSMSSYSEFSDASSAYAGSNAGDRDDDMGILDNEPFSEFITTAAFSSAPSYVTNHANSSHHSLVDPYQFPSQHTQQRQGLVVPSIPTLRPPSTHSRNLSPNRSPNRSPMRGSRGGREETQSVSPLLTMNNLPPEFAGTGTGTSTSTSNPQVSAASGQYQTGTIKATSHSPPALSSATSFGGDSPAFFDPALSEPPREDSIMIGVGNGGAEGTLPSEQELFLEAFGADSGLGVGGGGSMSGMEGLMEGTGMMTLGEVKGSGLDLGMGSLGWSEADVDAMFSGDEEPAWLMNS